MNRKFFQASVALAGALIAGDWAVGDLRAEESTAALADRVREQERVVEQRAGPAKVITESAARDFVIDRDFDVVGSLGSVTSVYEDTLVDIARLHGVGYEEIRRANPGVDTWLPGEGTTVRLPTRFVLPRAPRRGLVITLPSTACITFPKWTASRS